jgi:hypothetical protein
LAPLQDQLQTLLHQHEQHKRGYHRKDSSLLPSSYQQLGTHLEEVYADCAASILQVASDFLPVKQSALKSQLDHQSTILGWKPNLEWRQFKQKERAAWSMLSKLKKDDPGYAEAVAEHRQSCIDLRLCTKESHDQWLQNRLHKVHFIGPSYVTKSNWVFLTKKLIPSAPQRLPTTVRTTEGLLLSGQTGAHHWHKARAAIGSFDPLAPFDRSAHRDRTLKLDAIHAKDKQFQRDTERDSACTNGINSTISREEIITAIQTASSNTAPGVDNIPNELLKKGGDAIVGVLHKLFNIIWLREAPPTIWERALIRPLYKTGSNDPLLTENYRAITLICTTCKLHESILYARVPSHLESARGLSPGQGSRRHMGCQELVYALVSTAQARKRSLGRGTYACFIDFKLAYPSTDHSVFFTKLHEKGIQGPIWRNIAGLYANMKSHVLHPHNTGG